MSETEGAEEHSPTDSLNLRPTELIPPSSPVRFADLCNGKKRSSTADVSSEEQEPPNFGISPGVESPVKSDCFNYVDDNNPPECLTPTLEDCALSEMLVKVANKDKYYIGGEMVNQQTGGVKLVGQTPTPDECLSPFWTKQFPGHVDDVSRDGPGGEKKASSPSAGKKKSPVTLNMADNRMFVINNRRVVEDGASLGRLKSSVTGATVAKGDHIGHRYYHEGMVMELIPGQPPSMKAVDAINPQESIDCGSSMKELLQNSKVISPDIAEKCWVESGFCAYLVLRYDDPENPQLEAMNSPTLHKTLKELDSNGRSPSDEHFTPLVNITREDSGGSQNDYTTALFFTTEKYTYFIYVENQSLVLKKYKTGDPSWQARPQNNKQFLDKNYPDSCDSKQCTCGPHKGKEEVDGGAKRIEKTRVDSSDTEDSAEGLSNTRSSCASSQLSSPEGASVSPSNSKSKVLRESETMDSGVEAN